MADNGIDVGYKGMHATVQGQLGVFALMFILAIIGLGWVNYRGFEQQAQLLREQAQLIRESNLGHTRMAESQDLMSCILTLPMESRFQASRLAFKNRCLWLRISTEGDQ